MTYRVLSYRTTSGKQPYDEWLENLRDRDRLAGMAIDSRLARLRDHGNFGDHRFVGNGVYELRIHFGPGYRVYYISHEAMTVILLCGGQKRDQWKDMARA